MARDTDSLQHHEDRRARMKAEYKQEVEKRAQVEAMEQAQQVDRDQTTRESEIKYLEQQVTLVQNIDSRDMLLERIRRMREPPPPPPGPPPRTKAQQEELEREQANGMAAVAKNKEAEERSQPAWREAEAEERKRLGTMETVHIPNPSQNEQFPASGATLGKVKK